MATCDICGNEFKNNSGLSGHKQLAHRFESADGSAFERSPERFVKRSDQLQERLVRLLEQIQPQLERIEQAALLIEQVKRVAAEDHKHGMSDPECPGCIEVVRESLNTVEQKARDETTAYYEDIPGVKQLREIWEEQQEYRKQLKAEGKDPNQELITILPNPEDMITITGLAEGDTVENVVRRAMKEAY